MTEPTDQGVNFQAMPGGQISGAVDSQRISAGDFLDT
jgi:hypothetical protein